MSKFLEAVAKVEIEPEATARMILNGFDRQPIRDAEGSLTYIDLYPEESEVGRKHERLATNKRLAMRGRGKLTAAEIESERLEKLVALTAGWGSISKDGVVTPDPDFSKHDVRTLYQDDRKAEIRLQVEEFLADRVNFSKASSNS